VERLEAHRRFYADLITASVGAQKNARLREAFASIPRERFVGPGPWHVFAGSGFVETPADDPAYLYQDVVVSISPERHINNGQPTLHALSLAALNVKEGETVLHVGTGAGYYTAILAKLAGATGSVMGYELERDLAETTAKNLADFHNVQIECRSGAQPPLPECQAIYVNAGATAPLDVWLDALLPGGRLLFPLTPADSPTGMPGAGGMLLITRVDAENFDARFLCPAMFIPCVGARDKETGVKLAAAFKRGDFRNVRSLHRHTRPDDTCWCAGHGWWLSTLPLPR
jgi:protein-L-isoaspartate(D-aspartate) O-methyltransferase